MHEPLIIVSDGMQQANRKTDQESEDHHSFGYMIRTNSVPDLRESRRLNGGTLIRHLLLFLIHKAHM